MNTPRKIDPFADDFALPSEGPNLDPATSALAASRIIQRLGADDPAVQLIVMLALSDFFRAIGILPDKAVTIMQNMITKMQQFQDSPEWRETAKAAGFDPDDMPRLTTDLPTDTTKH